MSYTHKLSVAPMLDWTDRHCRYFLRQFSKHTVLYTEMVTTGAIIHGKGDYLSFDESEHPIVLQLGGSDPSELAICARRAESLGYDEINLNVGCPSDRVQNGRFGACLMAQPQLVADCIKAMQDAASIPVTVKTRIGIDEQDSYEFLTEFVNTVASVGCEHFIIHARKAWLSGLSPKQNREIPPLDYPRVYQLKRDFPQLQISLNGGVKTLDDTQQHLRHVDGVMIGREIYQNPYLLADADQAIWGEQNSQAISREQIIAAMVDYVERHIKSGGKPWHVYRHMLGLCNGLPGGKKYRRHLSEQTAANNVNADVLKQAFEFVACP